MDVSSRNTRLLLTGGGTGGHLFPAVASAEKFQKIFPGSEVLFVGTKRKIDTKSLALYGFRSESIVCYGLKGKSVAELFKAVVVLPISLFQAFKILLRFKPDVILGVGGYVTGPVVVAGKLLRIPAVIHEQNSIPGLANRALAKFADTICLSLPGSENFFPAEKVSITGNPVREKILGKIGKPEIRADDTKTLLVLGGSQGAKPVNELVTKAICSVASDTRQNFKIIHQTGENDEKRVKNIYDKHGVVAEVKAFFSDMSEIYVQADLVVSRAGATSLAEMSVIGKPVILIPYPYAADNHQEKNGEYYVHGGGALQFREQDLTYSKLAEIIFRLISDDTQLDQMGHAMKNLSYPDAAEKIVECCLKEIKRRD